MTFHLRHGPSASLMFYSPYNGHECWTDDANLAFRFEDRADAEHVRGALMLVDASLEVAIVRDCPKAEQQREAIRQMEADEAVVMRNCRPTALTMLAMHDVECGRGMMRTSLERAAEEIGAL